MDTKIKIENFSTLDDSWTHFRIEFRGSENTLRVRQIKLLGVPALLEEIHQRHNPKLTNAFQIQQRNCEAETLRVFRLITAQVNPIEIYRNI